MTTSARADTLGGSPPRVMRRRAPGHSLTELLFVMSILSGAFVAVLTVMNFIANGMYSERVQADQYTRGTGTFYDLTSELREVAVYSPNFYIEENPLKPPRITFDKIDSVDPVSGTMLWGSRITYRLDTALDTDGSGIAQHNGIFPGRVVREELDPKVGGLPQVMVIEENVPFQYVQNGVTTWGFNLGLDGCALTVTLSRFGDTRIELGDDSKTRVTPVNQAQLNGKTAAGASIDSATSSSSQGTCTVFTVTGVYYLRNPQEIIPAQ